MPVNRQSSKYWENTVLNSSKFNSFIE
jgi:hypothetical protein